MADDTIQQNDTDDIDDVLENESDDSHYVRQTGYHDDDTGGIDDGLVHPGVDEDTE